MIAKIKKIKKAWAIIIEDEIAKTIKDVLVVDKIYLNIKKKGDKNVLHT